MALWESTHHTIADIRDWRDANKLTLCPDFQRKEVWTEAAKISLIDSILARIPIPKFYVERTLCNSTTARAVIDGQQRFQAILQFLNNELQLRTPHCRKEFSGWTFDTMPSKEKDDFLNYRLDLNEITSASSQDIREIYSRINKYVKALNKQELRKADFPGAFLEECERISSDERFAALQLFSRTSWSRMADTEFVSELMAMLVGGRPLEKKEKLDDFYEEYMTWEANNREQAAARFFQVLRDIEAIFADNTLPRIQKTRFKQKSDFYCLFGAISAELQSGGSISSVDTKFLERDLLLLDEMISPSSDVEIFSEYGIRCVSSANSQASRNWRIAFLRAILHGTYCFEVSQAFLAVAKELVFEPLLAGECPGQTIGCDVCNKEFEPDETNCLLAWRRQTPIALCSTKIIGECCANTAELIDWITAKPAEVSSWTELL